MREIKFRGKRLDNDEWAYGSLVIREQDVHGTPGYFISAFGGEWIPVDPETVGQFTGLKVAGQDLYEDDIVRYTPAKGLTKRTKSKYIDMVIEWSEEKARFRMRFVGRDDQFQTVSDAAKGDCHKIIGDIHSNPELLK